MIDITFEQIRAFLAVAQYKSFSAAASKVFRTQAALSIQISRLEEITGIKVFDRTTKYVRLTEGGKVLHKYLGRLETLLLDAEAELGDLRRMKKGTLRLSTSDTTACYRLPGILRQYNDSYPGIDIIVRNAPSPKTMRLVSENNVDLGIVTLLDVPHELEALPLFPRHDLVIYHPGHPFAGRESVFLKDLESYDCILLDRYCATRKILDRVCEGARVRLSVSMELSSVEVIKRFVRVGAGISVVPAMAVEEEMEKGLLASSVIVDYLRLPSVSMGVVYRKNRYLSLAVKGFLSMLS
ncbi:MAG: LysR family transcriptional regulator [Spirochaetales bacterium]|nr:LysR family transcriptional regulator [Spirochaetales bacterium]